MPSESLCFILTQNLTLIGSVCASRLGTSSDIPACLLSMLWHHVTALRQTDQRDASAPNWHSVFRHALSRINNLLHNILVWTRGEIPADWNMWQGFDCVDPHFPSPPEIPPLLSPPAVRLLFPPSLPPLAQTPLYPFTPFREAVM